MTLLDTSKSFFAPGSILSTTSACAAPIRAAWTRLRIFFCCAGPYSYVPLDIPEKLLTFSLIEGEEGDDLEELFGANDDLEHVTLETDSQPSILCVGPRRVGISFGDGRTNNTAPLPSVAKAEDRLKSI